MTEPFFNKVAGVRPQAYYFIKKVDGHRCFPVNFAKFVRTPFLQNTSGRFLLSDQLLLMTVSRNNVEH